jgi:transcriptional regulator with XRE-family HTH domain
METIVASAIARVIDDLRQSGGLQGRDLANIAQVSPATVSRWSNGKASPDLRTQTMLAGLRYVVERLSDYYDPDETRLWLHAAHPLLGGAAAIDLIHDGRMEEVLAIIETMDAGAYS